MLRNLIRKLHRKFNSGVQLPFKAIAWVLILWAVVTLVLSDTTVGGHIPWTRSEVGVLDSLMQWLEAHER